MYINIYVTLYMSLSVSDMQCQKNVSSGITNLPTNRAQEINPEKQCCNSEL